MIGFPDELDEVPEDVMEHFSSRLKDRWCIHCGSHQDNQSRVKCSSGRHNFSELSRENNIKKFPYEILTDYEGNIIHNGKTPYRHTLKKHK